MQNLHLTFVCMYCRQKYGGDFAKFCSFSEYTNFMQAGYFELCFTCFNRLFCLKTNKGKTFMFKHTNEMQHFKIMQCFSIGIEYFFIYQHLDFIYQLHHRYTCLWIESHYWLISHQEIEIESLHFTKN